MKRSDRRAGRRSRWRTACLHRCGAQAPSRLAAGPSPHLAPRSAGAAALRATPSSGRCCAGSCPASGSCEGPGGGRTLRRRRPDREAPSWERRRAAFDAGVSDGVGWTVASGVDVGLGILVGLGTLVGVGAGARLGPARSPASPARRRRGHRPAIAGDRSCRTGRHPSTAPAGRRGGACSRLRAVTTASRRGTYTQSARRAVVPVSFASRSVAFTSPVAATGSPARRRQARTRLPPP